MQFESQILKLLDVVSADAHEAFLEKAHREGQAVYDSLVEEAKKRILATNKKHQEDMVLLKQRERVRLQNKAKLDLNRAKTQYINSVLDAVHEALINLDESEYIALLMRTVATQDAKETPRIRVPKKHYEVVAKQMGQTYQVVEDEDISDGFILSYRHFDVNMELRKIMHHNKDALTNRAMHLLFGGDDA